MSEKTFSATKIAAVTKSDTTILEPFPVALFIGGAGDIAIEAVDGGTATFTVPAGTELHVQARRVLSTGTDATNIIALYN